MFVFAQPLCVFDTEELTIRQAGHMKSLGVCALYYKEQQVFLLDDVCSCLPFIVLQQVGFITQVKNRDRLCLPVPAAINNGAEINYFILIV